MKKKPAGAKQSIGFIVRLIPLEAKNLRKAAKGSSISAIIRDALVAMYKI